MDKKNNLKQAVYEVFGVGSGGESDAVKKEAAAAESGEKRPAATAAPAARTQEAPAKDAAAQAAAPADKGPKAVASYLGLGTVLEGTLRSTGDVEIAGIFKGDIVTEGTVRLCADTESNVTAGRLELNGCALTGDVVSKGTVTVSERARIKGSVTAAELLCAGEILGDLNITGNIVLDETARIDGKIQTGTMTVARGAVIRGVLEMKSGTESAAK